MLLRAHADGAVPCLQDKREIEAQLREVTDSEAGLQDELQEKEQQVC
jgi:hypothetical protein